MLVMMVYNRGWRVDHAGKNRCGCRSDYGGPGMNLGKVLGVGVKRSCGVGGGVGLCCFGGGCLWVSRTLSPTFPFCPTFWLWW